MFLSALDLCLVLVEWTLHHRASSLICPDHPSPTFTPLAPRFESGDVASMISIAALDFSSTRPDFSMVHSLSRHMCAGVNPRVSPRMLSKEESLWVTHKSCADWLEDTLVWCVPVHQSKWFDRLARNAPSVHFILTLFIYLCRRLRRMIAVMAKVCLNSSFLCFFLLIQASSFHPTNRTMML